MDHVKLVTNTDKPNPRQCGGCTACCTVYPVKALNKPAAVTCKHVCSTGCAIYSTHPQECKTYECLWRANHVGTEDDRPDKTGVIFGSNYDKDLGVILYAQEFRKGSIEKMLPMIENLARRNLVYLAYYGNKDSVVMGPFNRAAQLSEFLEAKNVAFQDQ